jgi:hypothetical protein
MTHGTHSQVGPRGDASKWLLRRRQRTENCFVVANGISANRHHRADLEETMAQLGYRPVDDASQAPSP